MWTCALWHSRTTTTTFVFQQQIVNGFFSKHTHTALVRTIFFRISQAKKEWHSRFFCVFAFASNEMRHVCVFSYGQRESLSAVVTKINWIYELSLNQTRIVVRQKTKQGQARPIWLLICAYDRMCVWVCAGKHKTIRCCYAKWFTSFQLKLNPLLPIV